MARDRFVGDSYTIFDDCPMTEPPRIVHAVLPWHPTPFETPLAFVLPLVVVVVLIVMSVNTGLPWQAFVIMSFMGLLFGTPFLVFFATAKRRLWAPRPTAVRAGRLGIDGEPAIETMSREIGLRRGWLGSLRRLWSWREFVDGCERYAIARPTTVIDTALVERLARIERPAHGLEPESIVGSTPQGRQAARFVPLVLVAMALLLFSEGHMLPAAAMLFVAVSTAITGIPALRDRLRGVSPESWSMLAGLGAIRDRRGRVWTVNDALLVVQTRELHGPLWVRLIGTAGERRVGFIDETDPDFVALWQRWNHPHPRPELLEDSDGFSAILKPR